MDELKFNGWTFRVGDRVRVQGAESPGSDRDAAITGIMTAPPMERESVTLGAHWITLDDGTWVRPGLLVKVGPDEQT